MQHLLAPLTLMTRCDTGFFIVLPLHRQRTGCYAKQELRGAVDSAREVLHIGPCGLTRAA